MKGQAVARILFVITLVVTAHAIRPFSMKNLTSHILYSTRSFAVVLPDSTRSSFDYANTLAVALSQSLFVDSSDVQPQSILRNNLTAMAKSEPVFKPQEVVAVNSMIKADPIESAELIAAERVKPVVKSNWEKAISTNDVAEVGLDEAAPNTADALGDETPAEESTLAELVPADETPDTQPSIAHAVRTMSAPAPAEPVILPVNEFSLNCALSKIRPIQLDFPRIEIVRTDVRLISLWGQIKKSDCDKRETGHVKLIAIIEAPRKPKGEKSATAILECEDEGKPEAVEAEAAGPQDEASVIEEMQNKIAPLVPINPDSPESCDSQR